MRRLSLVCIAAALLACPTVAYADAAECVQAAETGQKVRGEGKLRQAHQLFTACAKEECSAVQRDCSGWASEVVDALPSIVVDAHDAAGNDITNVSVTVDGELVAQEVDGRSIAIDPGSHVVVVQRGKEQIRQTILVKAGQKARPVSVTFRRELDPTEGPVRDIGGHTILPWVLVGLGGAFVLAGVAVALTAPNLPAGCDSATRVCSLEGASAEEIASRQGQAGQSVDQPKVGVVVAVLGGAIVVGGLLWHFLEKPQPRTARSHPGPLAWAF